MLLILIGGRLAVNLLPPGRTWGFDQARYFSFAEIAIFLLILIAIWAATLIYPKYGKFIKERIKNRPILHNLSPTLGLLAIVPLFVIFSDSTNLLGDGLLRAAELEPRPILFMLKIYPAEFLTYIIHSFAYNFVFAKFGLQPAFTYRFFSYLAGVLFVICAYHLAGKLKSAKISRWIAFVYILSWGGLIYFFGYVESYSLAAAVWIFLFLALRRYLETGENFRWVAVLFLLAFFLHNLTAVSLIPMTLAYWQKNKTNGFKKLIPILLTWAPVVAWGIFGYLGNKHGAFLLPHSKSEPAYHLFSGLHLSDMANELLLVSPLLPLLLILPAVKEGSSVVKNTFSKFLGLNALFAFACLFFIDPALGMARDWDLFCLPLLALHLYLFTIVDWQKVARPLLTAIPIFSIGITSGWILLNAAESKSLRRFEDILQYDWKRSAYGYETLANYHVTRGNTAEAERAFRASLEIEPRARAYIGLGFAEMRKGNFEQSKAYFIKAQQIDPEKGLAYLGIAEIYMRQQQWNQLGEMLKVLKLNFYGRGDPVIDNNYKRLEQIYKDALLRR